VERRRPQPVQSPSLAIPCQHPSDSHRFGHNHRPNISTNAVVQEFIGAARNGTLQAPSLATVGVSVPHQTLTVFIVLPIAQSSSSSSSSTGSSGSISPDGSVAVALSVNIPDNITATQAAPLLQQDIALNVANDTRLHATLIVPYVVITAFRGVAFAPASRPLLQTVGPAPVTFIILGNSTRLGAAVADTSVVVQKFQAAAAAGTLVAPNSGATIPAQNISVSVPGASSSTGSYVSSSSTGEGSTGGASAVVSASAAMLIAAVASLALLM
jgi:hypothetical protein